MVLYTRYVALGDSQTEGLNDGDETRGYRGWADRLAEHLSQLGPDVRYANLAVRGLLTSEVRAQQLEPALALGPDLATVVAGMNDLLRPRFDAAEVAGHLEAMYVALLERGARVAGATFPDIGRIMPVARPLMPRVLALNEKIRAAAARHGVALLDSYLHPVAVDPRIWSSDRLHASPLGHARIAQAMAYSLGLPGSDDSWAQPLPPRPDRSVWEAGRTELQWLTTHVAPWLWRHLSGRSSSDGRKPKRPDLGPI